MREAMLAEMSHKVELQYLSTLIVSNLFTCEI